MTVGLPLRGVTVIVVALTLSIVARTRLGGVCAIAVPMVPATTPTARLARKYLFII
jgi:hypothetical protein